MKRLLLFAAFLSIANPARAVWPIEIAGDDTMAIESGGTFQGYSSSRLDFFAFRAGALVNLDPKPQVVLILLQD